MNHSEYVEGTIKTMKLAEPKYVKQEPFVNDDGIYIPLEPYAQEGCASAYRCIMTKEMFIEAYNRYIKNNTEFMR